MESRVCSDDVLVTLLTFAPLDVFRSVVMSHASVAQVVRRQFNFTPMHFRGVHPRGMVALFDADGNAYMRQLPQLARFFNFCIAQHTLPHTNLAFQLLYHFHDLRSTARLRRFFLQQVFVFQKAYFLQRLVATRIVCRARLALWFRALAKTSYAFRLLFHTIVFTVVRPVLHHIQK